MCGDIVRKKGKKMGSFGKKVAKFWEMFYEHNGYTRVVTGLKNTLIIACVGLFIGIIIGTVIAVIEVFPKYKRLPRILNGFCTFYVGLFRGTPIVVQLLVAYYVILPLLGINMPALNVCVLVFGLNSWIQLRETTYSYSWPTLPGASPTLWKQIFSRIY
jgi:His/Glu/Gln/Arg/opine family amino acid ABC transporter permease subunit